MTAFTAEAHVATTLPRRYMGQLCKHFEHKLPVTLTDTHGHIAFGAGTCDLEVAQDVLILRASAADATGLAQVQDVVARHLLRFAFREPPEIVWHPAA